MISVAIIDDHRVFVDALEFRIRYEADMEFSGTASTLEAGRQLVKRSKPNILLLDVGLPDGDGINMIAEIHQISPKTQVVVLTCFSDENTLMRAMGSGANGFIPKSCPLKELISTIRDAAQGEIIMPKGMLKGLLMRIANEADTMKRNGKEWEELTNREKEILQRLARGKSVEMIASELYIAPFTVRTHIRNLLSKLGVHSRLEAVVFGMRHGLIDVPNNQMVGQELHLQGVRN